VAVSADDAILILTVGRSVQESDTETKDIRIDDLSTRVTHAVFDFYDVDTMCFQPVRRSLRKTLWQAACMQVLQVLQVPSNDTHVMMFHLPERLCRWLDSHKPRARPDAEKEVR
jgi:hypothetical protein